MCATTGRQSATGTVLVDDARVRVTRWDFAPGAETGWRRHEFDDFITPLTDCAMLLDEPAGPRRVDVPLGASYRRNAGVEHNVTNAGDKPMAFVEVELKEPARAE